MMDVIERPLRSGWVYPCTLEDLERKLREFPEDDLEGIRLVEMVPTSKYDEGTYGKYQYEKRPYIQIFAQPRELTYRANMGRRHIPCCLADEVRFGMKVEDRGRTLLCRWEPEALRNYVVDFVLPHEVGHHVCHLRRLDRGRTACPGTRECERFADTYAREHVLRQTGV